VIGTLRTAVAAALLLAAGNAWALGLGQIQVKSKRNQPLLAEIPIVSTTPGELAALQARLASPETFRRVGLAPPSGVAADLQFSLGSDAKGRPVIRVTTIRPVEQAMLNFLIEVDWGAGRLVREYSALVDAPNTAGAAVPPVVQAPLTSTPNLVQRPAAPPVVASAPVPPPAPRAAVEPPPVPAPTPAPAESPAPIADFAPQPLPPASAPPAPMPAPPAEAAPSPMQYGPVKQGETLSKIASGLDLRSAFSLDQTMLALLQANPDAFLGDDVNRLRSGAVLRVPAQDEVAKIGADEAAQVVRQQMRQWRQARRAVRQPEAVASAQPAASAVKPEAPAATATEAKPKPADKPEPKPAATAASNTPPKPAAPVRRQEARLQIVPPAAPGKATGTKSGTSAGGEGSMLQQELRQRDEDIAAKSAEIGELKERLAALEKLKDEQQKLITLKDSELAAAQARLAESNKAQQAPATTPAAKTTTQQPAPAADAASGATTPWLWGGIGVVVLALLAWLLASRRKPAAPARRSMFDSEALAASMEAPAARVHEIVEDDEPIEFGVEAEDDAPAAVDVAQVAATEPVEALAADEPARAPTWHSGWVKVESSIPAPQAAAEPAAEPIAAPIAEPVAAAAPDIELPDLSGVPAQATAEQRFKLARAFLDVGDEFSAQQLLLELLDDEDDAVSDEAARMLSKLVG
jgi:pilus assembly protein FimV